MSIFEINQDYESYRLIWEDSNNYFDPGFSFLLAVLKFFGFEFESSFAIISILPLLIFLVLFLKNRVNLLIIVIVLISLSVYLFGPIRQSLANSILLIALFSRSKYLYGLLSISIHWSTILPSAIVLFYNLKNNYYKYLIMMAIFIMLYLLYIYSPWFEIRNTIFLNDEPYYSFSSILFKLATFSLFYYCINTKLLSSDIVEKKIDRAALIGLLISFFCQFLGIYGLGENAIQRLGMMFDVFTIYSFIRIYSKKNHYNKKLLFSQIILTLIIGAKAILQYIYFFNLLKIQ